SGDNNTGNTPEDKVIVFTYELDTTKVDGQNNTEKLEGAEFKLHNADNKWAIVNNDGKVTGWADTEEGGSTLTSDANGLFKVIGLDDGTYYLKETKAPTGYNLLSSEITVVITATTTNGQTWTDGQASSALTNLAVTADGTAGTGNAGTGIAGITVANNKGSTLPETGSVGTTIFYIAGGVLAVAAAILLVTKKRMSKQG
ncbi:SpaA isopeptide-forming pilin-related protein, partial [Anaeromassilibacillus senegalensis]